MDEIVVGFMFLSILISLLLLIIQIDEHYDNRNKKNI